MGDSDKPVRPYSTFSMAQDTLELLDHVGWTGKRQLHVVGSSMGGMIAQHLVWNMTYFTSSSSLTNRLIRLA